MATVSRGLPPRDQLYMPHTSSPLNPSKSEAPLRRQKPREQCRAVKHEQSPTQRLMRQKAAVAWKTMSRDPDNANNTQTTHDSNDDRILMEKMNDSHSTYNHTERRLGGKYQEINIVVRQIDTEKQALADEGYREEWLPETDCLLRSVTTRRLITIIAILCIVGLLSAIRIVAIGRIQAWRT